MNGGIKLICPICSGRLERIENSYVCPERHSFDIARQGYVNLLPVQNKHSRSPGDTKSMLMARREFLNSGFYEPVCSDIAGLVNKYKPSEYPAAVDVGCGEGYYTEKIAGLCNAEMAGVDIAKEAAKMSCSRSRDILWLVATGSHIPIEDKSVDVITAVFSLFMNDEYARLLKNGGIVVEVSAGSDHLKELKSIIYDEVFPQNKKQSDFSDNFSLLCEYDRRFEITLIQNQLKALLAMTPHIHRINREQSERLEALDSLELTVNYKIRVLGKGRG